MSSPDEFAKRMADEFAKRWPKKGWARDEIPHLMKDAADKPAIIGRGAEEELGALIQNILLADIDVATEADAIGGEGAALRARTRAVSRATSSP